MSLAKSVPNAPKPRKC
jgi:hypothetical protein